MLHFSSSSSSSLVLTDRYFTGVTTKVKQIFKETVTRGTLNLREIQYNAAITTSILRQRLGLHSL